MLNDRKVLIVEAEFLIALDLQRMLEALGAGQVLFARNVEEARKLEAHWPDMALAIVERRKDDDDTAGLLLELGRAGLALVQMTSNFGLRHDTGHGPVVVKPIPEDALASAVAEALASKL